MVRTAKKVSKKRTKKVEMASVIIPKELNVPPTNLADYCTCIFGRKGIGKTHLVSAFGSSEKSPTSKKSFILMLEPNRKNLKIRQVNIQPVGIIELNAKKPEVTPWQVLQQYVNAILDDDSVEHVGIDTVDRAYAMCFDHQCYQRGITHPNDLTDYGATWSAIRSDFETTFNKLLFAEKGLTFISHSRLREVDGRDGLIQQPTCSPACWEYLKAVCDFAFYYSYVGKDRVLTIRGDDRIWSACGSEDHFLTKGGEPISLFHAGKSYKTAYKNLTAAFANKLSNDQVIKESDNA